MDINKQKKLLYWAGVHIFNFQQQLKGRFVQIDRSLQSGWSMTYEEFEEFDKHS